MFNKDFYPTPPDLCEKLCQGIKWNEIGAVLEPSAGKGDLVAYIINERANHQIMIEGNWYRTNGKAQPEDIDCIEIEPELQYILKGKGYRVIDRDFLQFKSFKIYDLIIMNPPFSNGVKHLLHAINIMKQRGGEIRCLLNAENIRNPYTSERKDLCNVLKKYDANVDYISNAFLNAERKTNVEVALIKINIPKPDKESDILRNLRKANVYNSQTHDTTIGDLSTTTTFIDSIVEQFNFEVECGLKLISEYKMLKKYTMSGSDSHWDFCLNLTASGLKSFKSTSVERKETDLENNYLRGVRAKYWAELFKSKEFKDMLPSNALRAWEENIEGLCEYDFSLFNIAQIKIDMLKRTIDSMDKLVENLFDKFSNEYAYYEGSNNIHYYNGWRSNKAWYINKKVIVRYNAYDWNGRYTPCARQLRNLKDIEKVFNYLDGRDNNHADIESVLKKAEKECHTEGIKCKYFTISFYKKGTCHIKFRDEDLLKKFNLFGSQRKGWLPPAYGKKQYKDMTEEERKVIDDFEGEENYNKIMNNTSFYLQRGNEMLMLSY